MKAKHGLLTGFAGILIAAITFIAACDNLGTGETVDKAALKTAIDSANSAKDGVETSIDGAGIYTTVYWVTEDQLETFNLAISAAQAVYTAASDQTSADAAKTALESATAVFVDQKQYGSLTPPDIYVAGQAGTAIKLWKNNIPVHTINDGNYNWVEDLLVSGANVYLAGSVNDGAGNSVARVWKNGLALYSSLPGGESASVTGINGSDIYVGGIGPADEYNYTGMVWKNGASYFTFPAEDVLTSSLRDMAVSGGNVYSLGLEVTTSQETWLRVYKNSSSTPLYSYTDGDGDGHIQGSALAVIGNDVFIAGTEKIAADKTVIKVWKNDAELYPYPLTTGYNAYPCAMEVIGTDVYVAGWEMLYGNQREFKIWKNGSVLYTLAKGEDVYGADMTILDGDVFTVGTDGVSAKVWRNSSVLYSQQNAEFRRIVVKAAQ